MHLDNRNNRWIAGALVLTALLARTVHVAHVRHIQAERYGNYTQDQIVSRSRPLIAALNPTNSTMKLTTLQITTRSRTGSEKKLWLVDGLNAAGTQQVHLVWEADTGELNIASHTAKIARRHSDREIGSRDAVRITGSWLTTLGVAGETVGWHADRDVTMSGRVWCVAWEAPQHKMHVAIDAVTGDLIMAQKIDCRPNTTLRVAQGNATSALHRF